MTGLAGTYAPPDFRQGRQRLLAVGVIGLAVCAIGAFIDPRQFFFSYLTAFMFWLGIALGCMAIVMLHHLSGGAWGLVIRRVLEAGTRTLPLMALLFVPIAFGARSLYEWARPEVIAADEVLKEKSLYLNVPFFLARAVLYFSIWAGLAYFLNRWSLEQDRTAEPRIARRLQLLSSGGIVLYALTITFASIDWVMSLEPHWYSTIFGVLFMGGQGLSALAFVIGVAVLLSDRKPMAGVLTPSHFHDLGKLLLAFVMLWAYFAFSQFLIIWSGNIAEEIPWYLHRLTTGWQWVGLVLIVFHFAVPFIVLLSRANKRNVRALGVIAAGVIVMRMVDLFWIIGPENHQHGLSVHWLDVVTPLAVGGIWLAAFVTQLSNRPLLPINDPYLADALGHHGH